MAYWAQAPVDREQLVLFPSKLDEAIGEDHPVRLLDEMLTAMDWSAWEARYSGVAGQPAIHPRVMAGAILYGLTVGVRTSRKLEAACLNRLDFLWLVEGRDIDHSTFAGFRKDFGREIRDLFKQIGRLALQMGLVRLNVVALDGTRVKANSSRHATASAKTLENRLAGLDQEIERLVAAAEAEESAERKLFVDEASPNRLPRELANVKKRQAALRQALAAAREADVRRAARGEARKGPTAVPVADPESAVMPNKEGGFAPNYTPMAAVDGESGLIVDADVVAVASESDTTVPTVERIAETFGARPAQVLADANHGSGSTLESLAAAGVDAVIPPEGRATPASVMREDGSRPVPQSEWAALPRTGPKGKLDRAAFLYDPARDGYWCPAGRLLTYSNSSTQERDGGEAHYRTYRSLDCGGCPLAETCLSKSGAPRSVSRDQHEDRREAMRARLATDEGRAAYRRRAPLAEGAMAGLKAVMGVRQFLLRGLAGVRTEWLWTCVALNLKKLIGLGVRRLAGAVV
jgi:transposase